MVLFLVRNGEATRDRIVGLVNAEPGIHTSDISTRLGLAWSTVAYHLRVLVHERRLSIVKELRERRAFPTDTPDFCRSWLGALRDDDASKVLDALLERSGQTVPELSARLGFTHKIVRRCLTNLEDVELVNRRGNLRPVFDAVLEAALRLRAQELKVEGPQVHALETPHEAALAAHVLDVK